MRKNKEHIKMNLKTKISIRNIFASAIFPCLLLANTTSLSAVSVFNSLDEPPLVAIGSAKVINLNSQNLVTVNGQKVVIDDQTIVFASHSYPRETNTVIGKEALRDGDYLYVFGELVQAGILLATNVYVSDEQYVDGVSRTYMKAILDRATTSVGIAYSGNSIIDYTAALHNDDLSALENDHAIELLGTSYGSHFFADSGRIIDTKDTAGDSSGIASYVLGQRGSGIRGQRGSGIRGQRGSGIRGQRGSGIRGQRGSGIRGQRGSGIR